MSRIMRVLLVIAVGGIALSAAIACGSDDANAEAGADGSVPSGYAEPHIPCYAVTRLDSAILRSIETEMTGKHVDAEANDVIRNVGKPDAQGKCKLSSGALVASF